MKPSSKTIAGVRTGNFSNAVLFLTEVLDLELVNHDKEKEIAKFQLPSGGTMEVFGPKHIWHPFSTPPDWEVIVADIRYGLERN